MTALKVLVLSENGTLLTEKASQCLKANGFRVCSGEHQDEQVFAVCDVNGQADQLAKACYMHWALGNCMLDKQLQVVLVHADSSTNPLEDSIKLHAITSEERELEEQGAPHEPVNAKEQPTRSQVQLLDPKQWIARLHLYKASSTSDSSADEEEEQQDDANENGSQLANAQLLDCRSLAHFHGMPKTKTIFKIKPKSQKKKKMMMKAKKTKKTEKTKKKSKEQRKVKRNEDDEEEIEEEEDDEVDVDSEEEEEEEEEQEEEEEDDEDEDADQENELEEVEENLEPELELIGHMPHAINVPFDMIFDHQSKCEATADAAEEVLVMLKNANDLRDLFQASGIEFETQVDVISDQVEEAAAVATALLIAGHTQVNLCSFAFDAKLLEIIPQTARKHVFMRHELVFQDSVGGFDLSPSAEDDELPVKQHKEETEEETDDADDDEEGDQMEDHVIRSKHLRSKEARNKERAEVRHLYDEAMKPKFKTREQLYEEEEQEEEYAQPQVSLVEGDKRYFEMPQPLSKQSFLDVSSDVLRLISFVLAPLGFTEEFRSQLTLDELKTKTASLVQDTIEVCSDIVYAEKDLCEGGMAMSVHKWLETRHDRDCSAKISELTNILQSLYTTPRVIEIPDVPCEEVQAMASDICDKMQQKLHKHAAWAFDVSEQEDFQKINHEAKETISKSWSCMYPTVAYSLGFIPKVPKRHKRLSTLQLKTFIHSAAQALNEAVQDRPEELKKSTQVIFQALCETLPEENQQRVAQLRDSNWCSLYIMSHTLKHLDNDDEHHSFDEDDMAFVEEHLYKGDNMYAMSQSEQALALYTKCFSCMPLFDERAERILTRRASVFIDNLKDLERGELEAQIALRVDPFSHEAYKCLGKVEEAKGNMEQAMQHYITSFILDGSRSTSLADCIDRVSRHVGRKLAKNIFEGMEKNRKLPANWLVDSYMDSFEHDIDYVLCLNQSEVDKSLEADGRELVIKRLVERAVHYKRTRQYQLAQRDILLLVERQEELDAAQQNLMWNLHASFLYAAGDVCGALDAIEKALPPQKKDDVEDQDGSETESDTKVFGLVNSLVKKGGFLCEIGDFDAALDNFEEAMRKDSNDADVYLHRGQMELLNGNYQEAVSWLRRAMTRSEQLVVSHITYGMALYKSGSTYQATDVFEDALERFPDSPELHLFYGEVMSDQGNYSSAMQHFLKAFELSPKCPLPFLNAGRVFVTTNDPRKAIEHFRRALQVDSNCSSAHLDVAQVLFAQGLTKESFEHFERAATCCRFLPEVEEVCSCEQMAKMQLRVGEILGVDLRHMLKRK